jgi:plasmid stabilization system protein ParE
MTRIELAPAISDDFERILDHLVPHDVADAAARIDEIVQALDVLASNPRIGRRTENDLRELVIGRGTRGYVVLYRYVEVINAVFVLAIKAQREAGCRQG